MDDGRQVSWMAITAGTPVVSSDGEDLGKVTDVVADREKGIFSGIVFRSGLLDRDRFAPGDLVGNITTDRVRINVAADEAEALEPYQP